MMFCRLCPKLPHFYVQLYCYVNIHKLTMKRAKENGIDYLALKQMHVHVHHFAFIKLIGIMGNLNMWHNTAFVWESSVK